MDGGTTFHFVMGGIHDALARAREAAGGMDVRVGGGANTIQQYLRESLIDELHIATAIAYADVVDRVEKVFTIKEL